MRSCSDSNIDPKMQYTCMRSRWLDIGNAKKKRKKTRVMSNHLDRKSLVTKGFIRKQKDFDVIRIKNDSFVSNTINP